MKPVICIPYQKTDEHREKAYQKVKEYYSVLDLPMFCDALHSENLNRAKMRNKAVRMIDCEYDLILFFDADVIIPYEQVKEAIKLAYETNEMVIMFDYLFLLSESVTNQYYKDNFLDDKYGTRIAKPPSGAFIVPRNIWETVGGQDERFIDWGGEDRAFYFACAAVKNKRVVQRIKGKAYHLFHPRKKYTLQHLKDNKLLQKYLNAVEACPRFTVPDDKLKDNSKIFSILKEENGPLYVEPKVEFIPKEPVILFKTKGGICERTELNSPMYKILKNSAQFTEIKPFKIRKKPTFKPGKAVFITTCGYYEEVDKNSPSYLILKQDPQFKEIKLTNSTSIVSNPKELCVLNKIQSNNRSVFKATKKWVNKNFSSLYSFEKYVVVLGYNIGKSFFEFKKNNPDKKIIVYQLEQLFNNLSQWYNPKSNNSLIKKRTIHVKEWLDNADEIWDYDLDNKEFLESIGYKIKHVPLTVDRDLKYSIDLPTKEYDLVFYGAVNAKRYQWLKKFDEKYNLLFIGNVGNYKFKNSIEPLFEESLFYNILKAKVTLNLHYYDSGLQEQIRLFELLSNDVFVISEKSKRNYLKVPEFDSFETACQLIDSYLQKEKMEISNIKNDTIKIGSTYNSFYGLEFIERSIISIRKEVDYIALIHQKESLKGEPEPAENKEIIKSLLDRNLIDEIVYVTNSENLSPEFFILHKRNVGLDLCRKNKCHYIIPLDTDEVYNGYELRKEIDFMHKNNIDTLYSPIVSYYYNEFYSFKEDYYVSSVYKVNDRNFIKTSSSVLVDPVRKMEERKYKVSNVVMHHYTYLFQYYKIKVKEAIASQLRSHIKSTKTQLLEEMQNFDGIHGHVFCNDKNKGLKLKKIILERKN